MTSISKGHLQSTIISLHISWTTHLSTEPTYGVVWLWSHWFCALHPGLVLNILDIRFTKHHWMPKFEIDDVLSFSCVEILPFDFFCYGLPISKYGHQNMWVFWHGRLNILLTQSNVLVMTSVACAVGPSVTKFSTDFSFQDLVFWNLFEFSAAEIT